jgi:hypothetical protein
MDKYPIQRRGLRIITRHLLNISYSKKCAKVNRGRVKGILSMMMSLAMIFFGNEPAAMAESKALELKAVSVSIINGPVGFGDTLQISLSVDSTNGLRLVDLSCYTKSGRRALLVRLFPAPSAGFNAIVEFYGANRLDNPRAEFSINQNVNDWNLSFVWPESIGFSAEDECVFGLQAIDNKQYWEDWTVGQSLTLREGRKSLVTLPKPSPSPAPVAEKPKPPLALKYKNCAALQKVYAGGVALSSKSVNKGGKIKLKPTVNAKVYNLNKSLDRDKDGIACER